MTPAKLFAAELVIVPANRARRRHGWQFPRRRGSVPWQSITPARSYVGATGGFGAEIDYDTIYLSQIEEKVLDFVALATGA